MSFFSDYFYYPHALYLLVPALFAIVTVMISTNRARSHLSGPWAREFGEPVHIPKAKQARQTFTRLFEACGLLLIIIALARPQWGEQIEESRTHSLDIVIALDVSQSMNAEDLSPSRLEHAKASINRLLELLGSDRVSLVVFAGEAYTILPFTPDHGTIKLYLSTVDTNMVSYQGTSFDALSEEVQRLTSNQKSDDVRRALVIYTDGEDHDADGLAHLKKVAGDSMVIFAVGSGTRQGAPIPTRDERGHLIGYKKSPDGQPITSRLNESLLQEIAQAGHGKYIVSTPQFDEIPFLRAELLRLTRHEQQGPQKVRRQEHYHLFLSLSLLFWFLAFSLPLLRKRRAAAAAVLFGTLHASASHALSLPSYLENQRGKKSFHEKKYPEAKDYFLRARESAPPGILQDKALFNLGRSLEEAGDVQGAKQAFQQLANSEDPELRALGLYALGNLAARADQRQDAIDQYLKSMQALRDLNAKPAWSEDLSHNLTRLLSKDSQQQQQQKQSGQGKQGDGGSQNSPSDEQKKAQDEKQDQAKNGKSDKRDEKDKKDQQNTKQDPQDSEKADPRDEKQKPGQNMSFKSQRPFKGKDLTPYEAQQLLDALQDSEQKSLRQFLQMQRRRRAPTHPEKDW
jgi:Ca-activated chloride channel family protein